MLRVFCAPEKTNSFYPAPWHWSTEPFPALRGAGATYAAFLAVAASFTPRLSEFLNSKEFKDSKRSVVSDDFSKIIKTAKGSRLLVPCGEKEDEKLLLITALGGFRGGFSRIEGHGAEILWVNSSTMHCAPIAHIIARITEPDGYVLTETGRRCSRGDVEIYSWRHGYIEMPTSQYEIAVETGVLFSVADIEKEIEKCESKAKAEADSRKAKIDGLGARMEAVNARIKTVGAKSFSLGETYFNEKILYTEGNIQVAETKAAEFEKDASLRIAKAEWQPHFEEAASFSEFAKTRADSGHPGVQYCLNVVSVNSSLLDNCYPHFEYSADGLLKFAGVIYIYEENFQKQKAEKAKAEAECIARENTKAKKAEADAKDREIKLAAEAEARAAGLPGNITIWHRDGATNAGCGWVISPDSTERGYDEIENPRPRYQAEGYAIWRQILPGEVVLKWAHAYTAAEHEFEVIYRPNELTEAQREKVAEIEQELESRFLGVKGMGGSNSCPSIGVGWNL